MTTKNKENIGSAVEGNKSAVGIDIFVLAQKQHIERRKADEDAERRRIAAKFEQQHKDGDERILESTDGEMGTGESSILLCGAPKSGKSTLLNRFLESASSRFAGSGVEGTVALEYTFVGKTRPTGGRQLVNCWELAGGSSMSNLLEIPLINSRIIHSFSLLLFIDLTRPETIQSLVDPLIAVCQKRLEFLAPSMAQGNGTNKMPSADKRVLRPLGIPFVVVCARYDEFQNLDSERKRLTYRCIRLLAHINGASIITFSIRMDSLMQKARSLLAHLAFGTPPFPKAFTIDAQQPIHVCPHGMDSFEKIDLSSGHSSSLGSFTEAMFYFVQTLNDAFPQQSTPTMADENEDEEDNKNGERQFVEPAIDNLVEDGMRRLELYAKERRNRMEAEAKTPATGQNVVQSLSNEF